MTVQTMHYDLKVKLNKIDSAKYRDVKVPEIDLRLNEAQEVFVKMVAQPRLAEQLGFEIGQRTIDDISILVVDQKKGEGQTAVPYDEADGSYIAELPEDYWFYLNSKVWATKGICEGVKLDTREVQHDDEAEASPFNRSSFIWREANVRFNNEGIRIFTNNDFQVLEICLDYLKEPPLIHNAGDWDAGGYYLDGTLLTGTADCILPNRVHREIVDIAVMLISGDLSMPDYMVKKDRVLTTTR